MKRIACLLPAFLLALFLTACGSKECPENTLTALLAEDRTSVTFTSVTVSSHQVEDNDDTVTATVEYENDYATFTSEMRIGTRYFPEQREWILLDVYEETPTAVEPKALPTAEDVTALFDADRGQCFTMMGLCQDGLLDSKNPLMLDIGFTVGEATRVDPDPTQPMLSVPLDVEGQRDGWFTTHGTIVMQLAFAPDDGSWSVADVQPGMGAVKAGLQKLDKVVAVDTVETKGYTDFKEQLDRHAGKNVDITVLRNGRQLTVNAEIDGSGKLGILLAPITEIYKTTTKEYTLWESVPRGISLGVEKLSSYVSQMKYVFTSDGVQQLGGFGAIGSIFPEKWNWEQFWSVTAFLSVILAFMNILPIPALDGGHVLFLLYEIITRRQPSEKFMEHAQIAGMAFLFLLLIYANGNDIYRFFFK